MGNGVSAADLDRRSPEGDKGGCAPAWSAGGVEANKRGDDGARSLLRQNGRGSRGEGACMAGDATCQELGRGSVWQSGGKARGRWV
jgi:hypothetical protein